MSVEEKDLLDIVGDANTANVLLHGETGEMVSKILNYIADKAENMLCNSDLNERQQMMLIERIRLCRYEFKTALNRFSEDGELAFQDIQEMHQIRESEPING